MAIDDRRFHDRPHSWIRGGAHAFPLKTACPSSLNEDLTYVFSDNGDRAWDSSEQIWVGVAGRQWELVQHPTGGDFVDFRAVGPNDNPEWTILIKNIGQGFGGRASCSTGEILLDLVASGEALTQGIIKGIAVHEVGHAFDLAHSGGDDSWGTSGGGFPTERPTMATCQGGYYQQASIGQDDWANLEWDYTGKSTMHANSSFEAGVTFWRTHNGGTLTIATSGGADGPGHALVGGLQGGGIYQATRISDPGNMDVRVNYRKLDPASSGTVTYQLTARQITYPQAELCEAGSGVSFPNNWDLNDPTVVTSYYVVKASLTKWPTTSWQWPDTANWNPPSSWDGADVRVKIINNMTVGQDPASVRIDHARARDL